MKHTKRILAKEVEVGMIVVGDLDYVVEYVHTNYDDSRVTLHYEGDDSDLLNASSEVTIRLTSDGF